MIKQFSMVLVGILVIGCSTIPQQQAEATALMFIQGNVKFFAKDQNITQDLPQYTVSSTKSYQQGKSWFVVVHVTSNLGNETKKNDLIVEVDSRNGKVVSFNGRKL